MNNYPKISVLLPVYNQEKTIKACIESVLDTTGYPNWEFIVINDGSTDKTPKILERFKHIKLINLPRSGIAKALNVGFQASDGNDIVRIHGDVTVETQDWLRIMVEMVAELPKAGILGGKLVYADDKIQSVGRRIITGLGFRDWYANIHTERDDHDYKEKYVEVDSVSGAFAFYRKELIRTVGGIDENYFPAWMEDDDFCIAARYNNYKVYVIPSIKIVHHNFSVPIHIETFLSDSEAILKRSIVYKQYILAQHYKYWRTKWGWDPLYPDLNKIRRLYRDTEICWRIGNQQKFEPKAWPPTVDAVIVTYNNKNVLRETLDSLANTDYPKNLLSFYVVNNGSKDGTREFLDQVTKTYPFPLHPLHLDVNVGAPAGLNWGFLQGSGEFVVKMDDDITVSPGWLNSLLQVFLERPYAGCAGGKTINANDIRDIQCGAVYFYPEYYNYINESNDQQANYWAKVVHVQGACCVYRRDVLTRCGLLDIGFSPSQFDDIEHHIRLNAQGYEVIYNGDVEITHKFGFNALGILGQEKVSQVVAHQQKLMGKWSSEVYKILEKSIDLSEEGRVIIPNNRLVSEVNSSQEKYPHPIQRDLSKLKEFIHFEERNRIEIAKKISRLNSDHLEIAQKYRYKRNTVCLKILHFALRLEPYREDLLRELTEAYHDFGVSSKAALFEKRANRFSQSSIDKTDSQRSLFPHVIRNYPDTDNIIKNTNFPEYPSSIEKIMLLGGYGPPKEFRQAIDYISFLSKKLADAGYLVDFTRLACPRISDSNLVHLVEAGYPLRLLTQIKAIRSQSADIPILTSLSHSEVIPVKRWVEGVISEIFYKNSSQTIEQLLGALATGNFRWNDSNLDEYEKMLFQDSEDCLHQIIELSSGIICDSLTELREWQDKLGINKQTYIVPKYIDAKSIDTVGPELFLSKYGIKDFILFVGVGNFESNLLLLLYALRNINLPVVVILSDYDVNYLRICQKYSSPKVLFLLDVSQEVIFSAMQAARVFVCPSWTREINNSLMYAAISQCALVLSHRSYAKEFFGTKIHYCDPADVKSIKHAVISAYEEYEKKSFDRDTYTKKIRETFDWDKSGLELKSIYSSLIYQEHKKDGFVSLPKTSIVIEDKVSETLKEASLSTIAPIDIIIPIYGQREVVEKCVRSVLQTTPQAHLILVDDCSPGGEILELFSDLNGLDNLTLLRMNTNRGFIEACHEGTKWAKSPYLLFLNSDVVAFEEDWLSYMYPLKNDVKIVGALLIYPRDAKGPLAGKVQHAGVARNDEGIPYHPFLGWDASSPEVNQQRYVNAVTGACFLIERKVWDELGGWDRRFGRGVYEDVDLCWRARKKGYKILYQPKARLYHYESASRTLSGGHLLYEHREENLIFLRQRWKDVKSDEHLFWGVEKARKWQQARKLIHEAQTMIMSKDLSTALSLSEQAVKEAPELAEAVIVHAQILAQMGDDAAASLYYEKSLRLIPQLWNIRLQYVDVLFRKGDLIKAMKELSILEEVFPNHPEIQKRKLSPQQLLELILSADDTIAFIEQNLYLFDKELLSYIELKEKVAQEDGELDLAEGYRFLLQYVNSLREK
ncbi:MAG: glycosyltransferase [Thermosphaera sp.]